jgi:hypothetical protein
MPFDFFKDVSDTLIIPRQTKPAEDRIITAPAEEFSCSMISASEDLLYYGNSAEQSSSVFPCFKGKLQKLEDDTPLRRPCKNLQSLCGIVITEDSPDKKSTFVKVQDESEMLTEMVDEGGRGLTNGTVYVGAKVFSIGEVVNKSCKISTKMKQPLFIKKPLINQKDGH